MSGTRGRKAWGHLVSNLRAQGVVLPGGQGGVGCELAATPGKAAALVTCRHKCLIWGKHCHQEGVFSRVMWDVGKMSMLKGRRPRMQCGWRSSLLVLPTGSHPVPTSRSEHSQGAWDSWQRPGELALWSGTTKQMEHHSC
jgi:hypothetical protein